jgi:hypothetical protein
VIDPSLADVLESLQSRALEGEPRDHLVATVEWAIGVDPAMANRLIPRERPAAPPVADAARIDCEKPIRDEDGKFLGCEAGGGSGGATAGSSGSGSGAAPRMSVSEKSAAIEKERNHQWRSPEEKALRIKDIEEGRDPDQASEERIRVEEVKAKEQAERRRAEDDAAIGKAAERGHLLAVPSEKRRAHEELVAKIRKDIDGGKQELDARAQEAVEAIRGIQSVDSEAIEVDDLVGELTTSSESLGALTGSKGAGFDDAGSSAEGEGGLDEPEEPGDYAFDPEDVEDGETPEDAEDRQSRAHASEAKRYAEEIEAYEKKAREAIAPRAAKARDALIALHAQQTALMEQATAAKKLESAASRASNQEIADSGDEDDGNLVDPSKFRDFDDETGEWTGTPEAKEQYDEAWDASDRLRAREEEDREALALDMDTPIAELKQSAKTTAAVVKRLNQFLVRGKFEKAADQPKIPKKVKAKKVKGEPEDDDEDE